MGLSTYKLPTRKELVPEPEGSKYQYDGDFVYTAFLWLAPSTPYSGLLSGNLQ